jgi:hypothetical protein
MCQQILVSPSFIKFHENPLITLRYVACEQADMEELIDIFTQHLFAYTPKIATYCRQFMTSRYITPTFDMVSYKITKLPRYICR